MQQKHFFGCGSVVFFFLILPMCKCACEGFRGTWAAFVVVLKQLATISWQGTCYFVAATYTYIKSPVLRAAVRQVEVTNLLDIWMPAFGLI